MNWTAKVDPPDLLENDIHVWRFPLEIGGELGGLLPLLANDETRRASRFLFDRHREHFVVGRACARMILSRYIGVTPKTVSYAYDNLGKPRFQDSTLNQRFRFNFSNSQDQGLLAITLSHEIGVDLERIREMNDMLGLANRYFAAAETETLFRLPSAEQPPAFFRYWTRKEAYLKAVGKGLTFPLRNVHVSLSDSRGECRILDINGDVEEAEKWELSNLTPHPDFKAALAIRRQGNQISNFDFQL